MRVGGRPTRERAGRATVPSRSPDRPRPDSVFPRNSRYWTRGGSPRDLESALRRRDDALPARVPPDAPQCRRARDGVRAGGGDAPDRRADGRHVVELVPPDAPAARSVGRGARRLGRTAPGRGFADGRDARLRGHAHLARIAERALRRTDRAVGALLADPADVCERGRPRRLGLHAAAGGRVRTVPRVLRLHARTARCRAQHLRARDGRRRRGRVRVQRRAGVSLPRALERRARPDAPRRALPTAYRAARGAPRSVAPRRGRPGEWGRPRSRARPYRRVGRESGQRARVHPRARGAAVGRGTGLRQRHLRHRSRGHRRRSAPRRPRRRDHATRRRRPLAPAELRPARRDPPAGRPLLPPRNAASSRRTRGWPRPRSTRPPPSPRAGGRRRPRARCSRSRRRSRRSCRSTKSRRSSCAPCPTSSTATVPRCSSWIRKRTSRTSPRTSATRPSSTPSSARSKFPSARTPTPTRRPHSRCAPRRRRCATSRRPSAPRARPRCRSSGTASSSAGSRLR